MNFLIDMTRGKECALERKRRGVCRTCRNSAVVSKFLLEFWARASKIRQSFKIGSWQPPLPGCGQVEKASAWWGRPGDFISSYYSAFCSRWSVRSLTPVPPPTRRLLFFFFVYGQACVPTADPSQEMTKGKKKSIMNSNLVSFSFPESLITVRAAL